MDGVVPAERRAAFPRGKVRSRNAQARLRAYLAEPLPLRGHPARLASAATHRLGGHQDRKAERRNTALRTTRRSGDRTNGETVFSRRAARTGARGCAMRATGACRPLAARRQKDAIPRCGQLAAVGSDNRGETTFSRRATRTGARGCAMRAADAYRPSAARRQRDATPRCGQLTAAGSDNRGDGVHATRGPNRCAMRTAAARRRESVRSRQQTAKLQ
ncbi:UNVERIFIED_ORG: hypothetical protein J2791_001972 [Burkholderia contaminans]|nr:hypothetical protein [Burkholderia contaminans]